MKFRVREFQDSDPITEITTLLHRAYKPLADAGLKYVASYQDDERTLKRIKTGKCFVAIDQGRIIGTIVFYTSKHNRIDCPALYYENGVGHFGQFAVEPEFQKQGLGTMLMSIIERYALSLGHHTISFDTSAKALTLIKYYEKRGYEFAAYHQWADTNYRSVVMKKTLSGHAEK